MGKYEEALAFATERHINQKRKYTGEPYINHCLAVVSQLHKWGFSDRETMLCAAVLHDVIEDTETTLQEVHERFGATIAELVFWLTDFPSSKVGNRNIRTLMSAWRIARAPQYAQIIKLADLMDNTASIVQHDPKFAATYLVEKERLLDIMLNNGNTPYALFSEVYESIKTNRAAAPKKET